MIYFDNAATTFPKPKCVIKAVNECISKYCGNPGRSSHRLSILTSEKIYEAREKIARLLGVESPEKVVFTQNATHALNLAIKTTVKPNTHVLISDIEHNSVFRPIYSMSKKSGIQYSIFDTSFDIEKSINSLIKDNTKYIVSTLASNVIGREISLKMLTDISKKNNLTLITDASQIIGHKKINLSENQCDVLCAPGHKALFGIQGIGFAVFLDGIKRESYIEGGSGSDSLNPEMPEMLPERYEAGTLPSPSVISLLAGLDFIEKTGQEEIERFLNFITERCADIINSIPNSVLYEYGNGVISFNLANVPSELISEELDRFGVLTRGGLHCAPLAHKSIGTDKIGTVRVSLSFLNKINELDEFYKILKSVSKKYN